MCGLLFRIDKRIEQEQNRRKGGETGESQISNPKGGKEPVSFMKFKEGEPRARGRIISAGISRKYIMECKGFKWGEEKSFSQKFDASVAKFMCRWKQN